MFENYSQTYAAAITTFAGLLALVLGKYGFTQEDISFALGSIVTAVGIIWQVYHRFSKKDVTVAGFRKP